MSAETHCPKCRRERWTPDAPSGSINPDVCEFTGGATCVLTMNQNSLVEAVRSLAKLVKVTTKEDLMVLRTAMAVVEHVRPSSGSCPLCGQVLVTKFTEIQIHYPKSGVKLCDAVGGRILGGVYFPKVQ